MNRLYRANDLYTASGSSLSTEIFEILEPLYQREFYKPDLTKMISEICKELETQGFQTIKKVEKILPILHP